MYPWEVQPSHEEFGCCAPQQKTHRVFSQLEGDVGSTVIYKDLVRLNISAHPMTVITHAILIEASLLACKK